MFSIHNLKKTYLLLICLMIFSCFNAFANSFLSIERLNFYIDEGIEIKAENLTEKQISDGAFIALYDIDANYEHFKEFVLIEELADGKWVFNISLDVGEYEIRLYQRGFGQIETSEVFEPVYDDDGEVVSDDMIYEENVFDPNLDLLDTVKITVELPNIKKEYNNISGWAVIEIEKADTLSLLTEAVQKDFLKPITREEFCELAVRFYEVKTGKIQSLADADSFTDTKNEEILKAVSLGIVNGVGDDKFSPDRFVSRQEIAAMQIRAITAAIGIQEKSDREIEFSDYEAIQPWAMDGVQYLANIGVLKGSNGQFLPNANCTCEEAVAIILRSFEYFQSK